jgi:hypothetical protein
MTEESLNSNPINFVITKANISEFLKSTNYGTSVEKEANS